MSLYSQNQIAGMIRRNAAWIDTVSARYRIPSAAICAILHLEMERIDMLDLAADFAVAVRIFSKKDSSTGPMQVFGKTGIRAVNFAVDRGMTSYAALGLQADHRLDEHRASDLFLVWNRLHRDVHMNIEIGALNLLCCADEMTGRLDFSSYTPVDLKRIFTRYNQDTREITAYGEAAYRYYRFYTRAR